MSNQGHIYSFLPDFLLTSKVISYSWLVKSNFKVMTALQYSHSSVYLAFLCKFGAIWIRHHENWALMFLSIFSVCCTHLFFGLHDTLGYILMLHTYINACTQTCTMCLCKHAPCIYANMHVHTQTFINRVHYRSSDVKVVAILSRWCKTCDWVEVWSIFGYWVKRCPRSWCNQPSIPVQWSVGNRWQGKLKHVHFNCVLVCLNFEVKN